jgi:hypothetical protein
VPSALAALAVLAPLLQWAVRSTLSQGTHGSSGPVTAAQQLALLLEAAAAAVVSAAMHGPFGEPERIAGRRLPWLRLSAALVLTVGALAALSLGAWGTGLPGGELGILRDGAGLIGIGLLGTVTVGGHFAWSLPTGYFVLAAYAVSDHWNTPWVWPARPPHDLGAGLCATLVAVCTIAAVSALGPRWHNRD